MRCAVAISWSSVMLRLAARSARRQLAELDIEPHQVAALARDDDDVALLGRLDQRLGPDVREIGDGEHVHHAPGLVGRIAGQFAADGPAHGAAGAVAADHVAGAQRFDLSFLVPAFQPDRDRIIIGVQINVQIQHLQAVVRHQPRRRMAHDVQVHVVDPRLVEDHVRHFRQPVLDILHAAVAHDVPGPVGIGLPERRLVDPVALPDHRLGKAESVEHLHRTAGNPVGLSPFHGSGLALDDACPDVGKSRQLGR